MTNEPLGEIWTIGHSNRTIEVFLELLASQSIEAVADVRRFPGSRKWPHFGQEPLKHSLAEAGLEYRHFLALGGRRGKREPDSPNRGWRVDAFNAYADYMATATFREALVSLEELARSKRTAMMCSEALPWQCHRRLIADALIVRGWRVRDIMSPTQTKDRDLTDFAEVEGTTITYP
ncbi:MAG TPA: DUF488 domain-containing protein [Pirellulaceae bacterium]|jgi:uncharacterized protein (DUF488 family)|nr:DUF488 domain-containing protein [Pirellulaceae bacterium]